MGSKLSYDRIAAVLVLLCSFVSAVAAPPSTGPALIHDPLADELTYLKKQSIQKIGLDAVVEGFKKFIEKAGNDPRAAETMIHIGAMYESISDPELNIRQQPKIAMEWYRKAAAAAPEGSPAWREAQFRIAHSIRWADPQAGRDIYMLIAERAQDDLLTQVRVEYDMMCSYSSRQSLEAEKHARRILSWYRTPGNIPRDLRDKREIDSIINQTPYYICQVLALAEPIPLADRLKRIRALQREFPGGEYFKHAAEESIRKLGEIADHEIDWFLMERGEYLKSSGLSAVDYSGNTQAMPVESVGAPRLARFRFNLFLIVTVSLAALVVLALALRACRRADHA